MHIEKIHDLRSSPNINWVTKSRRMGWPKHVALMGGEGTHTDLCFGNLREGDDFEDQGVYGRIISKFILRK